MNETELFVKFLKEKMMDISLERGSTNTYINKHETFYDLSNSKIDELYEQFKRLYPFMKK